MSQLINTHEINTSYDKIDQIMLVDELSSTEYYVGWSLNTSDPGASYWRIKRIWKVGSVWKFEFPDGNQDYKWEWDERLSYSYYT